MGIECNLKISGPKHRRKTHIPKMCECVKKISACVYYAEMLISGYRLAHRLSFVFVSIIGIFDSLNSIES